MYRLIKRTIIFIPFILIYILFAILSRIKLTYKKIFNIKPSIVWGITPIINIISNSKAVKLYGYKSNTVVYNTYYITDEFDYNLEKYFKNKFTRYFVRWVTFLWVLIKYEIIHFYFDDGFLKDTFISKLELPLLKFAGKKIIVSAYGSDIRVESITRKLGKYNCCIDCPIPKRGCICDEKKAEEKIKNVNKWADVVCSLGDMTEYTPGSNNEIFYTPIDINEWKYVGVNLNPDKVKIIHAPNHPHYKGTKYLINVIEELKKEGYKVELILLEKIPNKEAKKYYESADIVAEQFIIGWYGYFAVECMALGKPVVSYIRKKEYLPKGINCPIVNANPDNLKEVLVNLIKDPFLRQELGKKGREYVEKVYSLERVGERWDKLYRKLF